MGLTADLLRIYWQKQMMTKISILTVFDQKIGNEFGVVDFFWCLRSFIKNCMGIN